MTPQITRSCHFLFVVWCCIGRQVIWLLILRLGLMRPGPVIVLYSYGTWCCPSLAMHINGYWQDDARGNSVVDKHLPQGMVEKLPVSSCYQNWDKLGPSGSYWLLCRFALPTLFFWIFWLLWKVRSLSCLKVVNKIIYVLGIFISLQKAFILWGTINLVLFF